MKTLEKRLRQKRPGLLILIDYPDFNLILAAKARKLGIPIFYYISPQVWAWRSSRVKKIRRLVDRMVVILPFEKKFYADHGMKVDFVGHPLMDSITTTMSRNEFLAGYDIPANRTLVGILPGSRRKEIRSMLPIFLEAARQLTLAGKNPFFLLPLAPSLQENDLLENGLAQCDLDIKIIRENRYDLMAACDLALAASGTVTLELAILAVPMVVSYRVSWLSYQIGHRLIKVKYASLVNLIADSPLIPELLQYEATPEKIARKLLGLWPGTAAGEELLQQIAEVRKQLGSPGASERVARLALATCA
jgi:lipid-A-disaccharide synthase